MSGEQTVAQEVNEIIQSANKCIDRGVDPQSGKRGRCHVFINKNDICQCGQIDLAKERMR